MIREFHGGFSPGEKKLEKFFSARRIISPDRGFDYAGGAP